MLRFSARHEAESLLKLCQPSDKFTIDGVQCVVGKLSRRPDVLIARIGMGEAQAADNTATIFQHFRLKCLILAGYGGALVQPPEGGPGSRLVQLHERGGAGVPAHVSGFDFAQFCTIDEIVGTPQGREAIARATEAQVADMETETVASVVSNYQIPFLAVRAISDAYDHVLPLGALAAGFNPSLNKPTPARFLRYMAMHPARSAR